MRPSFSEVESRLSDLKTLQGPVYSVERAHNFAEIERNLQDLKSLNYPIYKIDRQHQFNEIMKSIDTLKQMNFPVREGVDFKHQFNEIQEKAEGLKGLVGPVFGIEQRQHVFKVSNQFTCNLSIILNSNGFILFLQFSLFLRPLYYRLFFYFQHLMFTTLS